MNHVFADAHYWVAITNPGEADFNAALTAYSSLGDATLHTTDGVLTEFLNFYSNRGERFCMRAAETVRLLLQSDAVRVHFQSQDDFLAALALYEARKDKGYSLVDCSSMNLMRRHGIAEVMTRDRHFEQEGFSILIRE
jgi:uncharacterized protein